MASIARFVTHWRVELVLAAMVLTLGTTMRAQLTAAESCIEIPILGYEPQINQCLGSPSDCYICVPLLFE